MKYSPEDDGVTHVNVYSKAATWLGRMLSNFARIPFTCEDGNFASIEGYWYWLSIDPTEPGRDRLRNLDGFEAKRVGRALRGEDWVDTPEFKRKIREAISVKILGNTKIQAALLENDLPFTHYYVFHGAVNEPEDGAWILEHIEKCAEELKHGRNT